MLRILYTTDGSIGALAGAHLLAHLPLRPDDQIHVLTVVPAGEELREAQHHAVAVLAQADLVLCGQDSRKSSTTTSNARLSAWVSTDIQQGNPAEEILKAAGTATADLIVLGTRGLSDIARFFIGSVAERVVRHASCPVLLARPQKGPQQLRRVLLGVDGSDCSLWAADWLLQRFPLPAACEIHLVTVTPPLSDVTSERVQYLSPLPDQLFTIARQRQQEAQARLERMAVPFSAAGRHVETSVETNDPAHGLITAACERQADLLVVGAHGLSGIDRFLMGSVSEKVLRHAHCSVLVARPPAAE